MKEKVKPMLNALLWALILLAAYGRVAQAQTGATANPHPTARQSIALQATGANLPVQGSGTIGRLTKWTGLTGSNSLIGETTIIESKTGLVGLGTDTPTSKLTVQGMIETTLGGYKFPDGTVQTTAGISSILHDATLKGNGTTGTPLGVAVPLTLSAPTAQTNIIGNPDGVLNVVNTAKVDGGNAITAIGGDADTSTFLHAGTGIVTQGGKVNDPANGNIFGGTGLLSQGGFSQYVGGPGIIADGGQGSVGGTGVVSFGGPGNHPGLGGAGVQASGGVGYGAGFKGGVGLWAVAGSGVSGATNGLAAIFTGAVEVEGNFSVTGGGTKNFKIDHPLDPENKYLYHAAIESSEVLNIYSGNVSTDESGEATVTLPDWFEAINKDFRYQLTVLGTFAQAMVADEIKNNQFKIKTNAAGVKVSWQVTGIRSDAAMLKHPFKVEEDKPERERGSYLAPEAYGQPEERGIEWARNPQMMQLRKQQLTEAEQRLKRRKVSDR
jgi:hypothetical protein